MKKLIFILVAMIGGGSSNLVAAPAQDSKISCEAVTEYENGASAVGQVSGYWVYYYPVGSEYIEGQRISVICDGTFKPLTSLPVGTWEIRVNAYDVDNIEGSLSAKLLIKTHDTILKAPIVEVTPILNVDGF